MCERSWGESSVFRVTVDRAGDGWSVEMLHHKLFGKRQVSFYYTTLCIDSAYMCIYISIVYIMLMNISMS